MDLAWEQRDRRRAYRQWRRRLAVYVIGSPDFTPVKIGYGFPEERLTAFQTGSPFLLQLLWTTPGARELEWALHESFQKYRIRGEWFDFPSGQDPVKLISTEAEEAKRLIPEWGQP